MWAEELCIQEKNKWKDPATEMSLGIARCEWKSSWQKRMDQDTQMN